MPCFCFLIIDNWLLMSNETTVGCAIFYTLLKNKLVIYILVNLFFMLVWLTRFYLSFSASLIECHKHFHLVWENNCAVSAKQRSSCEDVYRVHNNSKVWPLFNFHELQTRNFLTSACFLRIL